jgi:hypothetical protein
MNFGVPQLSTASAAARRPTASRDRKLRLGLLPLGVIGSLLFAASAFGANPTVGLGTAASFSVLAGSTVTNTGPTTMFGDLGLSPGSSVTGAPQVLGATHVDDAVAIGAKDALTTAYNDAASRPPNGSAGTDLSGQTFTAGVRAASSSLLLSAGSVTLDAQGDPNAVFIFQIGSTLTTGSNTSVSLVNGAQACNVFWKVGSSATLGTGTRFVGTIMAAESITATTGATIHGRLLASVAAVTLDTNTITTSTCASSVGGGEAGGSETTLPTTKPLAPIGSRTTITNRKRAQQRRAAARRRAARLRLTRSKARANSPARPARPHTPVGFTG